jgi:hypothetical protein
MATFDALGDTYSSFTPGILEFRNLKKGTIVRRVRSEPLMSWCFRNDKPRFYYLHDSFDSSVTPRGLTHVLGAPALNSLRPIHCSHCYKFEAPTARGSAQISKFFNTGKQFWSSDIRIGMSRSLPLRVFHMIESQRKDFTIFHGAIRFIRPDVGLGGARFC